MAAGHSSGRHVVMALAASVALAATAGACGGRDDSAGGSTKRAPTTTTSASTTASIAPTTVAPTSATPTSAAPTTTAAPTAAPPATVAPAPSVPTTTAAPGPGLAGRTILVDPGHNGANGAHPSQINTKVFIGTGMKECDTTGTATGDGYSEAAYTFDVAIRLQAILTAAGAKPVMTRSDNSGVGPCITQRAGLGNLAKADVAVSIHADSSGAGNRGFHVIEPGPVPGYNDGIVAPSKLFGRVLRDTYAAETGVPPANYVGTNGEITRTDLGGLNLSKVPKVFIETGNMANATDAALLTDPAFRQKAAQAIADAMAKYLGG